MKKVYLATLVLLSVFSKAQVGIKTNNPQSTLDVTATNSTGNSNNVDGLLVPRVDRLRAQSMTGTPISTLIYVNNAATGTQSGITVNIDTVGYYYFDGLIWVKLHNPNNSNFTSQNIYNSDGTLTGNRTVTQGSKTLTFQGNVTNAFSVDDNTFSVDAANDRIGVGSDAPSTKLHIEGSEFLNAAKTYTETKNALDINIGQDGFSYGNRLENFGINMRSSSSAETGAISRINFGDVSTGTMAGQRYLSFSVGKNLNELMYLTDANGGNVGIGTLTPHQSAEVDITSTTKGFLVPRMTTAQRDAINNKAEGLMIYNIEVHCLQVWNATQWISTCGSSSTNGTATITDCNSGALVGNYKQGIPMNSSNTTTITVNVTQTGPWVLGSNTVNGITWTGSGNFTTLGNQNITITANGTPTNSGAFSYTYTLGASTCTRSITYTSSNGAGSITNCTSGTLNGNYIMGTAMNSGNTVAITINVTQIGPWSASSNTVNGVTWSGSGNFSTLGTQTITMTASGTPVSNGNFGYTFNLNGSNCVRNITFIRSTPPDPETTSCPGLGTTSFPNTYTIDGSSVGVTVTTSGTTAVANGITQCGVSTSNHPWIIGGTAASTTTYTFSKAVSNVQFAFTGIVPGEVITITAQNGGAVSPVLTQVGSTCNGPVNINGNKITTSDGSAIKVNAGGVYYKSITIQHNLAGQGAQMNVMLCNANTQ